jgi:hypothetical protein
MFREADTLKSTEAELDSALNSTSVFSVNLIGKL